MAILAKEVLTDDEKGNFFCHLLSALFMGMDCDETLPPYEMPDRVFDLTLTINTSQPGVLRRSIHEIEMGKGRAGFYLNLKNSFDETLEGNTQDPLGKLQIWWDRNPGVKKTFTITKYNELSTDLIDFDGNITFMPADSVFLSVIWIYWDDDEGTSMWEYLTPSHGSDGVRFPDMTFHAQAEIQLFKQTSTVYSDLITFTVQFYAETEPGSAIKMDGS